MSTARLPYLTLRRLQVLQLLSEGLTAKETGVRLGIAESSVRTHIRYILRVSGFTNITEAASAYCASDMLPGPDTTERKLDDLAGEERKVIPLLRKGCTNEVIGRQLGVSENTIKILIDKILEKWNVHTRTGIASIAAVLER